MFDLLNNNRSIFKKDPAKTPIDLYVLIKEFTDTEREAMMKVAMFLEQGIDIPHFFYVVSKSKYAVVYRYYNNEERAMAEYEKILKIFPDTIFEKLNIEDIRGGGAYLMKKHGPDNFTGE